VLRGAFTPPEQLLVLKKLALTKTNKLCSCLLINICLPVLLNFLYIRSTKHITMKNLLFVIVIGAALLNSCSKKIGPTPETLKGILLGKDTLTMYVGDTRQLPYTLTPSDISTKTLIFKSSDSTIISISNSGILIARKTGLSVVSVTNQDKTVSVAALVSVLAKRTIDSLRVGLIAYYPFNYDSAVDSSGNGNDGTIYDITSVSDRFGKPNSAFYFNGSSSYINVKDNAALRLSNTDFTINSWVNLDQYSGTTGSFIISKRTGSSGNDGWGYSITGNGYVSGAGLAYFGDGGTDPFALSKTLTGTSKWVMITTVYSFSRQEVRIYLNGVLDSITANMPPPSPSIVSDLDIGRDNINAPTNGYFLKGKIDDIRIYNRALSSATIQKLYTLSY
jgi:hypothetical protein